MDHDNGVKRKSSRYVSILPVLRSLVAGEQDRIAVMATVAAALYQAFDEFHWVGFYRRVDERTLKVGPYQGGHGCLTIDIGRGVCGACVREACIQIENDVRLARDHIACSAATQAEIVLPLMDETGYVTAVLDIDATATDVFDDVDVRYLQEILCLVPA